MVLVDSNPEGPNVLSELEAQKRASLVSNVSYLLDLKLQKKSPTYEANIVVRFSFHKSEEGTFLDFVGHQIQRIVLNGKDLTGDAEVFKSNRIHLPASAMKAENELHISYINKFDHTGAGFHQFTDPEDQEDYLYTNFEPFDAHRMIPSFDQPNIKATYKVSITAPSEWEVLANSPTTKTKVDDHTTLHVSEQTKKFSTYLFAVIAGPYISFSGEALSGGKKVPLRLLCRKSLLKFMEQEKEELFTITQQGMQFFAEFFDYPYPFEKYDQIWAPEFNHGAMENVGAVTFAERYIFRDPPTQSQRCTRADTILHEMAHMWFGNLVSPQWWDGLWLNESFATFMAAFATARATRFGELSWMEFNSAMKKWAEREDQQSTTHPIQGSVIDTDATFLNFDGITYGKGAAVLKQLMAVVGEDGFKAGLVYYFKKHEWGNTTIKDFLLALEHGYHSVHPHHKIDLLEWSRFWLETAGLNTLVPSYQLDEKKVIKKFTVTQTAPHGHPTLRPHKIEVCLFYRNEKGHPELKQVLKASVLPQEDTELKELEGKPQPDFVFLNWGDHAYAKVLLDPHSTSLVLAEMDKLDSNLLRQLLWGTFYHMVRDAKLKSTDFLSLVKKTIPFENNLKLVQSVWRSTEATLSNFVPDSMRVSEFDSMFDFCWKMLINSKVEDAQITWARAVISTGQSVENIKKLLQFMDKSPMEGFEFDQQMRWSVVTKCAAFGIEGWQQRLESEEKRDPSDRGQKSAATVRAAVADPEVKAKTFERILKDKESSYHLMAAVMYGFRWWHQKELLLPYNEKYFANLRQIFKEQSKEIAAAFCNALFPYDPEDDSILKKTEEMLHSLTPDEKVLIRYLKEHIDDVQRAKNCRALILKS